MKVIRQRKLEFGSISELVFDPARVHPHSHDAGHIWLLAEGRFQEINSGETTDCGPSDMTLHPAGFVHQQIIISSCRSVRFEISDSAPLKLGSEFPKESVVVKNVCTQLHGVNVVSKLWQTGKAAELSITAFVYQLIAFAWDQQDDQILPDDMACQAKDLIDGFFRRSISLSTVAESLDVSPSQLARTFKQRFNVTVGNYILKKRVESALHDLLNSKRSISVIALDNGFCDQAHLSRSVKRLTGRTPSTIRQNN